MTKDLAKWASEHGRIIKSGLSYGRREKFVPRVVEIVYCQSGFECIWEMLVKVLPLRWGAGVSPVPAA